MKRNIFNRILYIIITAMLCLTLIPMPSISAATVITENTISSEDGYDYELWKDSGNTKMTLTGGGTFSCEWSNINNALFRKGKKFDCTQTYKQMGDIKVEYGVDYNPNGNSYLCVYGWTKDPLIEYYIVESWGSWRPPGATSKGTITVDGGTYDVYVTTRENQPSIIGTTTFQQYWSVRQSKRTSGTISVSEHFKAWEKMGMTMGKMYETALTVEGYQSSGSATVKKNNIIIGSAAATTTTTKTTTTTTTTTTKKPDPLNGTLIKNLVVNDSANAADWKLLPSVSNGALIYGDRDAVYVNLPSQLIGAEAIQTACDSKTYSDAQGTFTAGDDITLYIAMDNRVTSIPSWLSGWEKTSLTFTGSNDVTFELYKKDFKSGETVTLGTNGQSSGCVNYAAMVVKAGQSAAGDVNADGTVSLADIVMLQKYLVGAIDKVTAPSAGDLSADSKLNVIDLAMLKRLVTGNSSDNNSDNNNNNDNNNNDNNTNAEYKLSIQKEGMVQIDVGTDKALDTIELELDTSNDYALHVNIGFWSAWANVQCSDGKLTEIEDSQNVDSVTIDGNKVTIKLSAGTYASANASNSSQAPYLGKVSLHHNSGDSNINVISYNITYVEVKTPDGVNIDDLIDMSELEGWATVEGDGLKTTTGGTGGEVVVVTNKSEFSAVSSDDTPRIIIVDGIIDCEGKAIRIGSNKTVVGADAKAEIKGGLDINTESNIIVANLTIDAEYPNGGVADCFAARNVHHMWVTHVTAHDAPDGLLDLTIGSNYITVSWCKFYYDDTSNDHRLACLDSNGTTAGDTDTGRNKVTYHHNWWAHGCDQRMPRILFGQGHVYNNYYSAKGNSYCIGVGSYASVLVENNYFKDVRDPHEFMYTHALPCYITANGNVYDNTTGNKHTGLGGGDFGNVAAFKDPPYNYELDNAKDIPSIVQKGAGPH